MPFEDSLRAISSRYNEGALRPISSSVFEDSLARLRGMWESTPQEVPLANRPAPDDIGVLGGISRGFQRGLASTMAGAQLVGGVSEEDRSDIARYTRRAQEAAPSDSYRRWSEAGSFSESWDRFWDDPVQITAELISESLPASALSLAGGAVGALGGPVGMGIGAGLGSALSEYASQYLDTIAESGVDLTNPEELAAALDDEELLDRARNQGIAKGIPIGIFDGATMGLAGKLVAPARAAFAAQRGIRTGARVVGAAGAEMLGQAASGAAGELAGELAAGQELNPSAIMGEAIGELGSGAVETAMGTARRGMERGRSLVSPPTPEEEIADLTARREAVYGTMGEPGAYSPITSGVPERAPERTPPAAPLGATPDTKRTQPEGVTLPYGVAKSQTLDPIKEEWGSEEGPISVQRIEIVGHRGQRITYISHGDKYPDLARMHAEKNRRVAEQIQRVIDITDAPIDDLMIASNSFMRYLKDNSAHTPDDVIPLHNLALSAYDEITLGIQGFATIATGDDGKAKRIIVLNDNLDEADAERVIAHEVGHHIIGSTGEAIATAQDRKILNRLYSDFLRPYNEAFKRKDFATVKSLFESMGIEQESIDRFMGDAQQDPDAALRRIGAFWEYATSYDEWFARSVSDYANERITAPIGLKRLYDTVVAKLRNFYDRVFKESNEPPDVSFEEWMEWRLPQIGLQPTRIGRTVDTFGSTGILDGYTSNRLPEGSNANAQESPVEEVSQVGNAPYAGRAYDARLGDEERARTDVLGSEAETEAGQAEVAPEPLRLPPGQEPLALPPAQKRLPEAPTGIPPNPYTDQPPETTTPDNLDAIDDMREVLRQRTEEIAERRRTLTEPIPLGSRQRGESKTTLAARERYAARISHYSQDTEFAVNPGDVAQYLADRGHTGFEATYWSGRRLRMSALRDIATSRSERRAVTEPTPDTWIGTPEGEVRTQSSDPKMLPPGAPPPLAIGTRQSLDVGPDIDPATKVPRVISAKETKGEVLQREVEYEQYNDLSTNAFFELADRIGSGLKIMRTEGRRLKPGELGSTETPQGTIGGGVLGVADVNRKKVGAISKIYSKRLKVALANFAKTGVRGTRANNILSALTIRERYFKGGPIEGEGWSAVPADAIPANWTPEQVKGILDSTTPEEIAAARAVFDEWNGIVREIADRFPDAKGLLRRMSDDFKSQYAPNVLKTYREFLDPEVKRISDKAGFGLHEVEGGGEGAPNISPIELYMIRIPQLVNLGMHIETTAAIQNSLTESATDFEGAASILGVDRTADKAVIEGLTEEMKKGLGPTWRNMRPETIRRFVEFAGGFAGPKNTVIIPLYDKEGNLKEDGLRVPAQVEASLKALPGRTIHPLIRTLWGMPTRLYRATTTALSLTFFLRNPTRDLMNAKIGSYTEGESAEYIARWSKTVWQMLSGKLGESDLRRIAEAWGMTGAYYTQQHVQAYDGLDVMELFEPESGAGHVWRQSKNALSNVENVLGLMEYVTRGTEMLMLFRQNMRNGQYHNDIRAISGMDAKNLEVEGNWIVDRNTGRKIMGFEAAFNMLSREGQRTIILAGMRVSSNFSEQGYRTEVINQMIPFYGPAIAGMNQFARVVRRDPGKAAALAAAYVTLPTIALWWKNRDEDWYRDQPATTRYLHYQMQVGDTIVKIPKPFEWGQFFGTTIEALLDSAYARDPGKITEAIGSILESISPLDIFGEDGVDIFAGILADFTGPLGKMGVEQYANRELFGGRKIVPEGELNLPAEEQVGPYTSEIAKAVGGALNVSPRRVEHVTRSLMSRVPFEVEGAVKYLNSLAHGKPGEFADVPAVGGFTQRGGTGGVRSESIDAVYEDLGNLERLESSRERVLSPDQTAYLKTARAATQELKLLRNQSLDASGDEKSRLGNEMRSVAQRALASRPADLGGRPATDEERLLQEARSLNRTVRGVLLERERESLRERMPNAPPDRIDQIAERRMPRRLEGISARMRIAARRISRGIANEADRERLRKAIEDLNELQER